MGKFKLIFRLTIFAPRCLFLDNSAGMLYHSHMIESAIVIAVVYFVKNFIEKNS